MAGTTPPFTIDPASPLWRHVQILEHVPGGGTCIWICLGCGVRYTSSYSRLKGHLCAIPGKGIKSCPGKDHVPILVSKVESYIKEQEEADARVQSRSGHPLLKGRGLRKSHASSSHNHTPNAAPGTVVESHPFMRTNEDEGINPKTTRGPLEMAFNNDARDIADEAIARCLYANGLSFNVVRSPYWQDMVRKINEAPKGYTGPGYEKVRTTLLAKEVKHIEISLAPIKASWRETGVSIISDGWKDAKNRPLINVIAMSPKGAM